jgi:hypothetical protein
MKPLFRIFVIKDNRNECFVKCGTKCAWVTSAAAKNAIMHHIQGSRDSYKEHGNKHLENEEISQDWLNSTDWETRRLDFDSQTRFQVQEIIL